MMKSRVCKAILIGCSVLLAHVLSIAQARIELSQIVITEKHSEIVSVPGVGPRTQIIKIQSSNPSVATAQLYRANQIQIVAVAPGKTTVEFFDNTARRQFIQPVWVQAANATGGGGAGLDKTRTQLEQVVMLPKHTHNVTAPGTGPYQLSSVTSSNPSVATARTNTRNTIQVYSVALGDTWINFADNASGTQYQVHIWVVNDANFKPPAEPAADPASQPKSIRKNLPPRLPGAKMDPCLVGNWISESLGRPDGGGAGVLLSIDKTGVIEIDYSQMQQGGGGAPVVSGRALIYMRTAGSMLSLEKIVESEVMLTTTYPNGETKSTPDLYGGPGVPFAGSYTCTGGTFKNWKQLFRRV
jgi:hypothetical protein